ncbi:MAG: flagellar biosynthesis protein FlgB [Hyphomonas sp.]
MRGIHMISDLPFFQVFGSMARYAAESQKVSAENIAHADEPGFKAQQIETFQEFMTRAAHGAEGAAEGAVTATFKTADAHTPAKPNGNTVSLEQELFNSADALGQHNLAVTVYEKSLGLMRTALGKSR